jgi:hypothetical protein
MDHFLAFELGESDTVPADRFPSSAVVATMTPFRTEPVAQMAISAKILR